MSRVYRVWIRRLVNSPYELIIITALDSIEAMNLIPPCVSWDFSRPRIGDDF